MGRNEVTGKVEPDLRKPVAAGGGGDGEGWGMGKEEGEGLDTLYVPGSYGQVMARGSYIIYLI